MLTAKEVEALARQPGMHAVEAGLFLQVKGNTRSWIHRYQFEKRPRYSGLGAYPATALAKARAKLKAEQTLLEQGIDPVAERKRQRSEEKVETRTRKTFKEVAKTYIADNEASWKNPVHRDQWPSSLEKHVYNVLIGAEGRQVAFGDMYVDEITTEHVCAVLRPIWYEKAETARRVRGRIEKILGSAKALGLRDGANPAALADNIALVLPRKRGDKKKQVRHHPALPYAEMPAFMIKLRTQESVSAKALEFVILTGVRTGDIIGQDYEERPPMMWPHVDLDAKLWTIPATKNDGEHTVPLSDAAITVLRAVADLDPVIVFPSPDRKGEPLSNNAMLALLDRMGHGDVTVHGMRSTFRDWVGEETNFPRELAEKAIQHTIGDETERAYQRGELLKKRRTLMEAWASYCNSATPKDDNVVVLRQPA
jgi:integrase